jgi:hypothetical protein
MITTPDPPADPEFIDDGPFKAPPAPPPPPPLFVAPAVGPVAAGPGINGVAAPPFPPPNGTEAVGEPPVLFPPDPPPPPPP